MALLGAPCDSLDQGGAYMSQSHAAYMAYGVPRVNVNLRFLGFCGVDDSVDPREMVALSRKYPTLEWGVLFRPDKEGTPRYASMEWLKRLSCVSARTNIRLAAHLCGHRVDDLLNGDMNFVSTLFTRYGFKRFQINATKVNGVDTSKLSQQALVLQEIIQANKHIEFIIQRNEETQPLWMPLISWLEAQGEAERPSNVSFLFDSSCGLGILGTSWPVAPSMGINFGYAGGIGPTNIDEQLNLMARSAPGRVLWVDMESSLRSKKKDEAGTDIDIFDLDKVKVCIQKVRYLGLIR